MARFTGLTSHTDILPVSEKYFEAIVLFIAYMSKPITSKDRNAYRDEYEFELTNLQNEEFTPNPDQARPLPRSMAAFEDCDSFEKPLPLELERYDD
jgi:hypothetical protein